MPYFTTELHKQVIERIAAINNQLNNCQIKLKQNLGLNDTYHSLICQIDELNEELTVLNPVDDYYRELNENDHL